MNFIVRAWRGQATLQHVVIADVAGGMLLSLLFAGAMTVDSEPNKLLLAAWVVGLLTFSVWAVVALWRCAFNSRFRLLGYIVRVWAVLGALLLVIRLLIAGLIGYFSMHHESPSVTTEAPTLNAEACNKAVKAYQDAYQASDVDTLEATQVAVGVACGGLTPEQAAAQADYAATIAAAKVPVTPCIDAMLKHQEAVKARDKGRAEYFKEQIGQQCVNNAAAGTHP